MNLAILLLMLTGITNLATNEASLINLRKLYYQAAVSKTAASNLSVAVKDFNQNSSPVLYCYKGAAYMMEAKYAFNPITKLSRFHKGKSAIEWAIAKDPEQAEMRFIRFSMQTNLPSFLGYDDHIESDKLKLISSLAKINDEELKENIRVYLITSKKCTKEELKKLNK